MVPTTECINIPSQVCDDVVEELCEEKCTPVWWCKVGEQIPSVDVWESEVFKNIISDDTHLIKRFAPTMWRSFPGA